MILCRFEKTKIREKQKLFCNSEIIRALLLKLKLRGFSAEQALIRLTCLGYRRKNKPIICERTLGKIWKEMEKESINEWFN